MIVLNKEQMDWILSYIEINRDKIPDHVDIDPREIKGERYILPESLLLDQNFQTIKETISGFLPDLEIREISENEYLPADNDRVLPINQI